MTNTSTSLCVRGVLPSTAENLEASFRIHIWKHIRAHRWNHYRQSFLAFLFVCVAPMMGPCWAYDGPMMGPGWAHVWAPNVPICGPCMVLSILFQDQIGPWTSPPYVRVQKYTYVHGPTSISKCFYNFGPISTTRHLRIHSLRSHRELFSLRGGNESLCVALDENPSPILHTWRITPTERYMYIHVGTICLMEMYIHYGTHLFKHVYMMGTFLRSSLRIDNRVSELNTRLRAEVEAPAS